MQLIDAEMATQWVTRSQGLEWWVEPKIELHQDKPSANRTFSPRRQPDEPIVLDEME